MSFDVDVQRRLGDVRVEVRFSASAGLTALYGPSGVGKSSVLNMIAGLLKPDRGRIVVAGQVLFDADAGIDLAPEHRRLGYVFQDGRLFPHLTVRDNLLYGRRLGDVAGPVAFDEIVDILGVGPLLARRPQGLSGGEARRVAIGRALLRHPRALLMDEPLSGVDPARREGVLALIERLRDQLGLPILYVSHDRNEVDRLARSVVEIIPSG
ncbi:MAG TPA: ATP-binding cassette domain-containing protein [Brevundimonas sp.]|uniref:ATP-binding cassette domain-containing protein n=1 Tax=Brevundimonas sp. TaxID=1871086 RepID=UPI002610C12F|nr:ATP-binding cassette domain-containing protein [Brevundimonas sp.]HRO32086.1 ATP-binding cassette domain-containing protein [Brevundimonas sp.]